MDEAYQKVQLTLQKTRAKQKKAAYHHRRALGFAEGDWLFCDLKRQGVGDKKGLEATSRGLENRMEERLKRLGLGQ